MKVLITGASGRVGSVVARALHEAGVEVRLTDRSVRKGLPVRVEVANLLDRDRVYSLVEGCEVVLHLGNIPNMGGGATAQGVFGENCAMNINVFQAARELGVKKVVFVSSVQVMNGERVNTDEDSGRAPSELKYLPLDGETVANAKNPYSLSKQAGELLLQNWVVPGGVQGVVVRLPACAGGGSFEWMRSRFTKGVDRHFMLDEAFAYLHVEDAGSLMLAIVRTDLPGYRVYFPSATSLSVDLSPAEAVERYFAGVEVRGDLGRMTSLVDVSRITRETGWVPTRSLRDKGGEIG